MDLGLLDLSVELSTRDIMAGKEFALFVLVKNPYNKPVWIREVNVSLPSDLKLANADKFNKEAKEAEAKFAADLQKSHDEREHIKQQIEGLHAEISLLNNKLHSNVGEEKAEQIEKLIAQISADLYKLQENLHRVQTGSASITIKGRSVINKIKVGSEATSLTINDSVVDKLEIYAPWLVHEQQTQVKTIKLESSLPDNTALQPSSTVVHTAVLKIKKPLMFTPSQYRLQFYVNYSFVPVANDSSDNNVNNNVIYTNTISHALSIRPSVYSVLIGAVIGGITGSFARLLQLNSHISLGDSLISIVLATILGAVAVIFMVRKSDTQSFISVEDFWGGLLIGFLVGYTGTSFFETLTKIPPPMP